MKNVTVKQLTDKASQIVRLRKHHHHVYTAVFKAEKELSDLVREYEKQKESK
jgi:hypothetical protein